MLNSSPVTLGYSLPLAVPPEYSRSRPIWENIVESLPPRDDSTEWYTLTEIAPLVGLKTRSLAKHARDLWPQWEGHYRLTRHQATRLIRRVCAVGRKLPARGEK